MGDRPTFHAFLRDITERRRAAQYLETQHAVTRALAEAETVDDAVPGLLRAVGEGMGWEVGGYWTPDAGGDLRCQTMWVAGELSIPGFERATRRIALAPGAGLPGRGWESVAPVFVGDVSDEPNFPRAAVAREAGLHPAVALPILEAGRVRGVIDFFTRAQRHGERELLEMMSTLSAQIGRFIVILAGRQEALAKLERLALTDELTGLANRRAWNEGLERELARARRYGEPLCVALLDLDHFKQFNDERGHHAGDDLLRQTAAAWGACVRSSDLLARYGGEEFALAFPAHPIERALAVVERLCAAMPAGLTCSAGLASWDGDESGDELLRRADRALYEAKRAGRDGIAVAD